MTEAGGTHVLVTDTERKRRLDAGPLREGRKMSMLRWLKSKWRRHLGLDRPMVFGMWR